MDEPRTNGPDFEADKTAVPRRSCRVCRWQKRARSAVNAVISVVPVERIELPTFGLQNRCSTAELNRLKRSVGMRNPGLRPIVGRQIPDLSGKGYSCEAPKRLCEALRRMLHCS